MPSDRKQFNVRMSDETAAKVERLLPIVSSALGIELAQSQFFSLAISALEAKHSREPGSTELVATKAPEPTPQPTTEPEVTDPKVPDELASRSARHISLWECVSAMFDEDHKNTGQSFEEFAEETGVGAVRLRAILSGASPRFDEIIMLMDYIPWAGGDWDPSWVLTREEDAVRQSAIATRKVRRDAQRKTRRSEAAKKAAQTRKAA